MKPVATGALDFQALFEASPGCVLVLLPDEAYRIVAATQAYLGATMRSRESMVGRPLFEVFPNNPDERDATGVSNLRASLDRVKTTRRRHKMAVQKYDIERPAEHGGGFEVRFWDPTNTPLLDARGQVQYILHQVEDVTELYRITEQRDAQRTAIIALEHERDLREQFVATLTHDLRSPLSAAMVGAQLVLRQAVDVGRTIKTATRIAQNLERIDDMIRDLLDGSRVRAGQTLALELVPCEMVTLVREVLDELATVHGDRFVLEAAHPIEGMWSDDAMRRVLENLCGNAIKYGASMAPIRVSVRHAGSCVEISVQNEGEPIPADEQAALFEPFRRRRAAQQGKQKGWGLGLTLVKGFVDAHGGTVAVTSAAERGTTFTVTLPLDPRHGDLRA